MHIAIKTTGHDLTADTRALLEEKFTALERLTSRQESVARLFCEIEQSVAVERAGSKYRAEGNLSINGTVLRAEAMGQSLEDAVDQVRDDLVRQLTSGRGKRRELVRRGGAALKRMLRWG